jgi:hypothetical protein
VWVLDTQTKGTGANMVPLERVLRQGTDTVPGFRLPRRRATRSMPAEARKPHRFRIVDVITRQVLAEDADARRAVQTLEDVRSIVDVTIYAWDETAGDWRRLTFGEAKALWELRGQLPSPHS